MAIFNIWQIFLTAGLLHDVPKNLILPEVDCILKSLVSDARDKHNFIAIHKKNWAFLQDSFGHYYLIFVRTMNEMDRVSS